MPQPTIVCIEQIAQYEDQNITIKGWLRHRRSSGKLSFLTVRDGTGDLQAIVSKSTVGEEQFALCGQVTHPSPPSATRLFSPVALQNRLCL